jgi:hypothetical protein
VEREHAVPVSKDTQEFKPMASVVFANDFGDKTVSDLEGDADSRERAHIEANDASEVMTGPRRFEMQNVFWF